MLKQSTFTSEFGLTYHVSVKSVDCRELFVLTRRHGAQKLHRLLKSKTLNNRRMRKSEIIFQKQLPITG